IAVCVAGVAAMLWVAAAIVFVDERASAEHTAPVGLVGDPARGRSLVLAYGCASCHVVGGSATQGMVGPPLDDIGARSYIAGRFPNVPGVMQQWLEHPQTMKPGTTMPDLGIERRDAADIAAYLATSR